MLVLALAGAPALEQAVSGAAGSGPRLGRLLAVAAAVVAGNPRGRGAHLGALSVACDGFSFFYRF